jgi:glutamyl-tRNA reductase
MRSQLVVIHRPRQTGQDEVFTCSSAAWLIWETCIRRLAIGILPEVSTTSQAESASDKTSKFSGLETRDGDEIFRGSEAYRFLLETVCGLRSPVRGETEVHGQFREWFEKLGPEHPLFKTLQGIHLAARKVRTAHLRGLGSQSYGSFARRTIKNAVLRPQKSEAINTRQTTQPQDTQSNMRPQEIHMIGGGGLAREILPWLTNLSLPVHVHVRNTAKHRDLERKYSSVQVRALTDKADFKMNIQTLLITAPVSSGFIADWLAPRDQDLQLVLDYRGESHSDPLRMSATYFSLQDIFREIESTKEKVDAEVEKARMMIQDLCRVEEGRG